MAFVFTTLPANQSLVLSLLSFYSWLSLALDLAQMVLEVRKHIKPTQFLVPIAFVKTNLPINQSLVLSLLSFYSWLSMDLALAQMVLKVQKFLKPTKLFIPNSFCFYNFAQK